MTDYKAIVGKGIKVVSTNIDNAEGEGQIWFNSTTGEFKDVLNVSAWSSSSNTNITRGSGYGFGTLTAGVTGLGEAGPPGLVPAATEEYNGIGWSTGNNYPRQDYLINACGTQTAGLASGGFGPPASDESNHYNGTSWTAGGDMGEGRFSGGMFGIQTAAIYCGGDNPSPGYSVNTELYNGSSWSEVNNLPAGKRQFATAGTSTAGLACGGRLGPGPSTATVEEWDGTNWTAAPSLNTARRYLQGWGIQTSALVCGGSPDGTPGSTLTEVYDGTSWSETGDLSTGRHFSGTSQNQGSNTSGWFANGNAGSTFHANTEEFSSSTNVVTNGAWATGGSTNTALGTTAGSGTQTAGIIFSGADNLNNTELYNGIGWTTAPTLNTGRYGAGEANSAPQTAALCFGGYSQPPGTNRAQTEEYNGSSWSEQNDLPISVRQLSGFGIQTAAVSVSGWTTAYVAESYEYNGTSWSDGGDINVYRERSASFGLETAGVTVGGNVPPSHAHSATVEEYNGASWTTATAYPTAIKFASACGIQTDGLVFSGNTPPNSVTGLTLGYDGTSWSTRPSMATARQAGAGAGTSTAALMSAGANVGGTALTTTEEFTGQTTALNVKTITTS